MAPQTKLEFILVNLNFSPNVDPEFPEIKYTSERGLPLDYLKTIDSNALLWVFDVLKCDDSKDSNLHFSEWDITSSDANMFKIHGDFYDQIYLIIHDDVANWFYNSLDNEIDNGKGWGILPINYCGCCLNTQYNQIIDKIKAYYAELCPCCCNNKI